MGYYTMTRPKLQKPKPYDATKPSQWCLRHGLEDNTNAGAKLIAQNCKCASCMALLGKMK